jgi:dethiobiotin synthetase
MASAGHFRFHIRHVQPTLFITGTNTGAGKTALTALLAQYLRGRDIRVAACKPVCSGGRADAKALHAALGGTLTLDEINPWHFHAPIAPALAARLEKRPLSFAPVRDHIRSLRKQFAIILVEGAGGLLSPLGEQFDSRDLIIALRAAPIIVAPNQLGAVNHLLLTLEALPKKFRAQARVVFMSPAKPDPATANNAALLGEFFPRKKIFPLPWLGKNFSATEALKNPAVKRTLAALYGGLQ